MQDANENHYRDILRYHELSKHSFYSSAPSPGYLDWDNQPDPFRRYDGAQTIDLVRISDSIEQNGPAFDRVIQNKVQARGFSRESISRFFFNSLALSAWKSYKSSKWALRVNPSSGNLHPTEAYLISGPTNDLFDQPTVCHYLSEKHCLEIRTTFPLEEWEKLRHGFSSDVFFVGLSSIYWREAWKYGERAFRYCHHDIGHAMASLSIAAAELGWAARLIENVTADDLQLLFGLKKINHAEETKESEYADCLIAIGPKKSIVSSEQINTDKVGAVFSSLNWMGTPNVLSSDHVQWDGLHEVARVTKKRTMVNSNTFKPNPKPPCGQLIVDQVNLQKVIRQRRSAVSMDMKTTISRQTFYQMLLRMLPEVLIPFNTLPWEPNVNLGLFIHRVEGLPPGLYFLFRNFSHIESIQSLSRERYLWKKPLDCPEGLEFYLLLEGDTEDLAKSVSCGQDIAADGCFSLAMVAAFEGPLKNKGVWFYPRLYWECGFVGQILYLLAEKYGIQSTGIGCFFDDPVHEIFGISDHEFQSLYHFTVGGAVIDDRLTTLPPYEE